MAFRSVAINYWLLCLLCALAPACAQQSSNTTVPQAPTTAVSTAAPPVLSTVPTTAAPTAAPTTAAPTFAAPAIGAPATVAPTTAAPTNANLGVILPAAIGGGLAAAGAAVGIALAVNHMSNQKDEDKSTFMTTTTTTLNSNSPTGVPPTPGPGGPKGRIVGQAQTAFWPVIFGAMGLLFILGLAVLLFWHKCRNRRNKRITRKAKGAKQVASAEVATKSADFEVTPLLPPYPGPPSIASSSVPMTSPVYRVIQGTPMATPVTANTLMPMQAQQVVTNPALPSTSVVMGSGNQLLTTSRLPNSYLAPMG